MSDQTVYLASTSPRRHQLLAVAGISFVPFAVPIDEDALSEEYTGPLDLLGEYLARFKALAAQRALHDDGRTGLVLASDTTVLLDGQSLAKPANLEVARTMLRMLRDREHVVATGVAVAGPESDMLISATSTTRVRMRDYSDEEIERYVATGDPLDKAGAYSIQHPAFQPVASIVGCHLGVIGLPVCIVAALLEGAPLPTLGDSGNDSRASRCPWSPLCTPPFPQSNAIHFVQSDGRRIL